MQFEEIWNSNQSHIKNFISTKVSSNDLEDILQEVSIALLQKINKNETIENPKTWLFQVARNKIIDFYKRTKKAVELEKQFAQVINKKFEPCVCDTLELIIKQIIPKKFSIPLILSDINKVPQKEIANQLGLSYENTKTRIQRARKLFKTQVEKFTDLEYNENGQFVNFKLKNQDQIPPDILKVIRDFELEG